jgi:hypothetical protein
MGMKPCICLNTKKSSPIANYLEVTGVEPVTFPIAIGTLIRLS